MIKAIILGYMLGNNVRKHYTMFQTNPKSEGKT